MLPTQRRRRNHLRIGSRNWEWRVIRRTLCDEGNSRGCGSKPDPRQCHYEHQSEKLNALLFCLQVTRSRSQLQGRRTTRTRSMTTKCHDVTA